MNLRRMMLGDVKVESFNPNIFPYSINIVTSHVILKADEVVFMSSSTHGPLSIRDVRTYDMKLKIPTQEFMQHDIPYGDYLEDWFMKNLCKIVVRNHAENNLYTFENCYTVEYSIDKSYGYYTLTFKPEKVTISK